MGKTIRKVTDLAGQRGETYRYWRSRLRPNASKRHTGIT
jgi:hypothetical protein